VNNCDQVACGDLVAAVAQAIVDDTSGDELFEKYLTLKRNVHRYSLRNKMLIMWQAPDSALVASRTAFSAMAAQQGHAARKRESKKGKSWEENIFIAAGSKAVWIWGQPRPHSFVKVVVDSETGEETQQVGSYNRYPPSDVYQAEDIRYLDTSEKFELPTFEEPIHDEALYLKLLDFAAAQGIIDCSDLPMAIVAISIGLVEAG